MAKAAYVFYAGSEAGVVVEVAVAEADVGIAEVHGAFCRGAEGGVELSGTGFLGELADVFGTDFATHHDVDAIGCEVDHLREAAGTEHCRLGAAGGEDAVGTCGDDGFDGRCWFAGHVDGAMMGDMKIACRGDKVFEIDEIDLRRRGEQAEDDAIGAGSFGEGDVCLHDVEFLRGIDEVAAAWPDHDVESDTDVGAYGADEAVAGGEAAF